MVKTFVLKSDQNRQSRIDYQKELNAEQYRAVTEGEGPCLVLAGAGSGKTRTIVYRVAYLIEHGVNPENILLVTFTNKAAKEMVFRVEKLLGQYPDKLWAGTFHHIGNRILRHYAAKLGYKSNFTILDEEDAQDLIKVCIREEGIDVKAKRFPSASVIKDMISYAKNSQTNLSEVIETNHPKWLKLEDQIKNISYKYHQKKIAANSMDFDDLLVNWLELLKKHSAVRDRLAAQFLYILVDEYQDTNYIQAEIVKELSSVHHNVLVVGDDAQSIYSFRAADIDNILNFPEDFPGAKIFKLQTNYRSTPEILKLANSVIAHNKEQYKKTLKPVVPAFVKPNLVPSMTASQEAEFISQMVLQLKEEGLALNKIAVLFRAAFHSQELEFALTKKDIPYDYRGGVRFFERAQVKDALAFLRVMANPSDEVSWHRILRLQIGIGEAGAAKIYELVKQHTDINSVIMSSIGEQLGARAQAGWQALMNIFKRDLKLSGEEPANLKPDTLILGIAKSDYKNYLEAEYTNWQERLDDLNQLAGFAEKYQDLNAFLADVTLQEAFNAEQAQEQTSTDDKIVLSTIHQAKGLEWEVVFIINLVDSAFPNNRALAEMGGLEEERRLFYVAITRAKRQLFLTYPMIAHYQSSSLNTPSRFIEEVNANLLEEVRLVGSAGNFSKYNDGVVQYLPDLDSL